MPFKPINPKEDTFYVFELSTTKYSVFDSQLDIAIYNGTFS